MSRNQILFYATTLDLAPVLSALEVQRPLQYTRAGLFPTDKPLTYFSYKEIPDFGRTDHPTAIANPAYLIGPQGADVRTRPVAQEAGGYLFAVDQLLNEDTVVMSAGGRFGNSTILYGRLGTASGSMISRELYQFAGRVLRRHFQKRREFLVGPEALEAQKAGTRLTISASSPPEFDLM